MSFPSVLHARGLPATRPATAPGCSCARRLDQLGVIKIPNFYGSDSHYRPCLQEYYADWAPEKLGTLDETLIKWEGKVRACVRVRAPAVRAPLLTAQAPRPPQEKRLFAKLNQKYKKPVNVAKCPAPAKAQS